MPKLSEIVLGVRLQAEQARQGMKVLAEESKLRMQQMREEALKLSLANKTVGDSHDSLAGKIKNMGKEIVGNIARFTAYYIAVGQLTHFIGGALAELRQFDEALHNIQSITQGSDEDIAQLGKDLLALVFSGNSAGASATQLAEGMYELVSAGYNTNDAMYLVQISAEGAAAGLASLKDTSKLLLAILQSYHLPVTDAKDVMDQLFTIVNLGVIHTEELTHTMGLLIPIAAELGVPLKEVGAAIELLTREGQQPSRIMTGLSDAMSKFLKPNKELGEAIDYLGYSSGKAMVQALGFEGALAALNKEAGDTTREVKAASMEVEKGRLAQEGANIAVIKAKQTLEDQANALRDVALAQEEANLSLEDAKDRVKDAKFALDDLKKAQKGKSYTDQEEREKDALALRKAERDYERAKMAVIKAEEEKTKASKGAEKAALDLREAQLGVAKADESATATTEAYNKSLKDLAEAKVPDREGKLAKEFGDIRAIREILPLTTNDGKDFNDMLAEQDRIIAEGDANRKALIEQKKAFNFQLNQATANVKGFAMVMLGPFRDAFTSVLKSVNNLFKPLSTWDEQQGKFVLNMDQVAKKVKAAWAGIAVIVGIAVAFFTGGLALIPFAIISVLIATGNLGKAWQLLQGIAVKVFSTINKSALEFMHTFMLAFEGGDMGGKHTFVERMGFFLGKTLREAIPVVKEFAAEMAVLAHLFVLGFAGGSIGGEFTKIELAAFKAGQVVHTIIDFVKEKVVPWALQFIVDVAEELWKKFKQIYTSVKALTDNENLTKFLHQAWDGIKLVVEVAGKLINLFNDFKSSPIYKFLVNLVENIDLAKLALLPFTQYIDNFVAAIDAINTVINIFETVVGWFNKIKGAIEDAVGAWDWFWKQIDNIQTTIEDTAKNIGSAFIKGLASGLKFAGEEFTGLADSLKEALKGAFNEALQWAHDHLKVDFGRVGKGKFSVDLGSIQFPLVQLAAGARDWLGGLAMMGENGPEIAVLPRGASVAPASKTSRIMDNLAQGGDGNASVYADFNISVESFDEIKRKLYQEVDNLDRQLRYRAQRGGSLTNGKLVM